LRDKFKVKWKICIRVENQLSFGFLQTGSNGRAESPIAVVADEANPWFAVGKPQPQRGSPVTAAIINQQQFEEIGVCCEHGEDRTRQAVEDYLLRCKVEQSVKAMDGENTEPS